MRSAIGVAALLGALALSQGKTPFDPAVRARALAPAVEEETFALARVDLARADVDGFLKTLGRVLPLRKEEFEAIGKRVKGFRPAFLAAGGREVVVSLSTADVPPVSFVYVPLRAGAGAEALTKLLNKLLAPWGTAERRGDALVAGPRAALDRLARGAPAVRPELEPAIKAAGNTAVQLLLLPTNDQRKVLEEMGPLQDLGDAGKELTGKVLVRGVRWAALGFDVGAKPSARLTLHSADAAAAKRMAELIPKLLEAEGKAKLIGQVKTLRELIPKEFAAAVKALTPAVKDDVVTLRVDEPEAFEAVAAVLRTMGESGGGTPGPESTQLKQILIALHSYHDTYGALPAHAIYSKDGKPLLSWRVAILPYLDQLDLYKQFKLDEPWDSPHNKKLIDKMPKVYRSPQIKDPRPGLTTYLVPVHREAAFTGAKDGLAFPKEFLDGTSNTAVLVDVSDKAGVIWTRPADLNLDKKDPWKGLLGHYPGFVLVGLGDGTVRRVAKTVPAGDLWKVFTRAGGEVLPDLFQ